MPQDGYVSRPSLGRIRKPSNLEAASCNLDTVLNMFILLLKPLGISCMQGGPEGWTL